MAPKYAKLNSQQQQQQQKQRLLSSSSRRTTATTTNAAQFVILNSLLLLYTTQAQPQIQQGAGQAVGAPQTAALAAPGPVASPGSSSSASILDQFSPNCSAVTHIFQARGIDANEIPQKPSNGK